MGKFLTAFVFVLFFSCATYAQDFPDAQQNNIENQNYPENQISEPQIMQPDCVSEIFANALSETSNKVNETDPDYVIKAWIYKNFQSPEIIKQILNCQEIVNATDDETIKFQPIEYHFPEGRRIVINYETQPKILKQRLMVANKMSLPETNPSPRIGMPDDPAIWVNTEPAWYGILVVQHGSLDKFVGEGKNNTISLKYIEQNINSIYPSGNQCTSKSALANNNELINIAGKKTVDIKDDSNDYYVAGDVNLQWITWAEVSVDVALTVLTMGGSAAVMGITKSARAMRATKTLGETVKTLEGLEKVKQYTAATKALELAKNAAKAENTLDIFKDTNKIVDMINHAPVRGNKQLAEYLKISEKDVAIIKKYINPETGKIYSANSVKGKEFLDMTKQAERAGTKLKPTKSAVELEKEIAALEKEDDVKKYAEATENIKKLEQLRDNLKAWRIPQRGNVIARTWKSINTLRKSEKILKPAEKIARAGTFSGRIRDWLFISTMKNINLASKAVGATGVLYTSLKFAGDMYDWTETSTGEFTSNIEFKPLGLLSADDLTGQENVVNYGMWLMWAGDSINQADDDAAYLQAMDFASK
ncbi:MAG TPA: hypothetical protein PLZ05_03500, partial [Alphaproteobacteria bacterium]|nr:hypothetical protein [Alphaproteobacteria bacterium]